MPRHRIPDRCGALALAFLTVSLVAGGEPLGPARAAAPSKGEGGKPSSFDSVNKTTGAGLHTDIFADEEAEFDSETRSGVFRGNVRVEDPEFTITCDELTVFIDKDEGGLREAIATGKEVTVVQRKRPAVQKSKDAGASDKPSAVGKGRKVVYDAKTGKATLSGWPQVQQGINLIKATEPDTVMIFTRGGKMTTSGRTKTEIRQQQ